MQVLHITPETNGYEVVTLLANRVSRNNSLAMILIDGVRFMTGGYILNDTPQIRSALDALPKDQQYGFVQAFKQKAYAKSYYYDNEKEK